LNLHDLSPSFIDSGAQLLFLRDYKISMSKIMAKRNAEGYQAMPDRLYI
jgi:hypothetical protein